MYGWGWGVNWRLLKDILGRYVPSSLFERPKKGFGVPLGDWMKSDLKEWTLDLLSEENLNRRHIYNTKSVRSKLIQHLNDESEWHYHLWDIMVFEQWCRHYGF